jgi:hypothetical protein
MQAKRRVRGLLDSHYPQPRSNPSCHIARAEVWTARPVGTGPRHPVRPGNRSRSIDVKAFPGKAFAADFSPARRGGEKSAAAYRRFARSRRAWRKPYGRPSRGRAFRVMIALTAAPGRALRRTAKSRWAVNDATRAEHVYAVRVMVRTTGARGGRPRPWGHAPARHRRTDIAAALGRRMPDSRRSTGGRFRGRRCSRRVTTVLPPALTGGTKPKGRGAPMLLG